MNWDDDQFQYQNGYLGWVPKFWHVCLKVAYKIKAWFLISILHINLPAISLIHNSTMCIIVQSTLYTELWWSTSLSMTVCSPFNEWYVSKTWLSSHLIDLNIIALVGVLVRSYLPVEMKKTTPMFYVSNWKYHSL